MLLRLEAFGRVLHVEFGKAPDEDEHPAEYVEDAARPLQVNTPQFVGFIRADPDQPGDARRVHQQPRRQQ